ncbi:MAG: cytochrome c [Planctomycetaceae bacterium]
MNVRGSTVIALGLLLPGILAGCGRPEAQFAFSQRMDRLPDAARRGMVDGERVRIKGLEQLLTETFGTPNDIVVWDKLPLDFGGGTFEVSPGWPATVDESRRLEGNKTAFEMRTIAGGEFPADPRGMRIEWRTGSFADALVQAKTGGDARPAVFRVDSVDDGWLHVGLENFDPAADHLVLSSGAVEATDSFPAPLPASEFVLVFDPRAIGGDTFEIAVRRADEGANELPGDPSGLAVNWLDGIYAGAQLESKRDGAIIPARFVVAGYDRDNHLLRLRLDGFDPARQEVLASIPQDDAGEYPGLPAPPAGVEFAVVGQNLQQGKKLYAVHCMHCHGVTGDGNGPTAKYLDPLPRDYRHGIFKFTSTRSGMRARREDLRRTVIEGIPGTNMPSFLLLEDDELDAIIEYVLFLAMRGEVEKRQIDEIAGRGFNIDEFSASDSGQLEKLAEYLRDEVPEEIEGNADITAEEWTRAAEEVAVLVPGKPRTPDTLESRQRGRALYLSAKAQCANCHGVEGLGNGPQTEDFEDDPANPGQKRSEPGLHDEWGHVVLPRNLTRGMYRGGRRPIDIYRRIHAGISASKMPSFGGTVLNDDEIWDVVNYVLSVPYEGRTAPPRPQTEDVAATKH